MKNTFVKVFCLSLAIGITMAASGPAEAWWRHGGYYNHGYYRDNYYNDYVCRWVPGHYGRYGRWIPGHEVC